MTRLPRIVLLGFFLTLGMVLPAHVSAQTLSSCTASVSPSSVSTDTSTSLTFNIYNGDENHDASWVKITSPSSEFTITGGSDETIGYSSHSASELLFADGGTHDPTEAFDYVVNINTGSNSLASTSWTIQMAVEDTGTDPVTCTGSTGVEITGGGGDTTAPVISSVTLSDISDSSAKVNWTTDELASSAVDYGTTASYGSTTSDAALTTSHSITIDGLSANTTYHYRIRSSDAASNEAATSGNTVTTAAQGQTITETISVNTTTTTTVTVTKLVEDTSKPTVRITTDLDAPFLDAPTISGVATDNGGISTIEYSLDDGRTWLPVDTFTNQFGKSSVFRFTPTVLLDGTYKVRVRTIDTNGNIGITDAQELVYDRLAPQVGVGVQSIGPQTLTPTRRGVLYALEGLDQAVTLSTVGGVDSLDVVAFLAGSSHTEQFSLVKDVESGFWFGSYAFSEPGTYTLEANAVDGAENETERTLSPVVVLPAGRITDDQDNQIVDARVTLYYFEPLSETFVPWDGAAFGQENPSMTDDAGRYRFIAHAGSYYVRVDAKGYKPYQSSIFHIDRSTPINTYIVLRTLPTLTLGPLTVTFPYPWPDAGAVSLQRPDESIGSRIGVGLIDKPLPLFTLETIGERFISSSVRGKPTVLTFLTSWAPQSADQLPALEGLHTRPGSHAVVIMSQESSSHVRDLVRRGGYTMPIYTDPDGELVEEFDLHHAPTHVLIDRNGTIEDIVVGVFSEEELVAMLPI